MPPPSSLTALADGPLDRSLVSGAVPAVLLVLGLCALTALCCSRDRAWWRRRAPAAVLLAGGLTYLATAAVDDWWRPFPDPLPLGVVSWLGIAVLGVLLALGRLPGLRPWGRTGAVVAAALVLLTSLSQVNRHYDQYPTLRAVPGPWTPRTVDLARAAGARAPALEVPAGKALSQVWRPPAGLPRRGTLSRVAFPATASGYRARDGLVYLPPAYQASPRPLLPVLLLIPGQPGGPDDYLQSGRLVATMDRFAAGHRGLAPVVVVADANGSQFANHLCMDSRLGRAQTYLARDVPHWVRAHLQTAAGPARWAVSGYSFGGTCSLQLAVNAPRVFGRFIDISGQDEPTLGDHGRTVRAAFGADRAAFARVDPVRVMARTRFPDTAGVFVAGTGDDRYGPQQRRVYAAARHSGMDATFVPLSGGHGWQVWRPGLVTQLPWLARRTGLIP
ncbi:alpha/beta hydrolase [Streptomyces sp. x-80]|jgi:enterochelin esterase-like enzyme|uniref:alpha/beta hydrolase n=1 Tax=Streptomyces sp. x-80 TaxID=2789282 RepID=UPI0039811D6B